MSARQMLVANFVFNVVALIAGYLILSFSDGVAKVRLREKMGDLQRLGVLTIDDARIDSLRALNYKIPTSADEKPSQRIIELLTDGCDDPANLYLLIPLPAIILANIAAIVVTFKARGDQRGRS